MSPTHLKWTAGLVEQFWAGIWQTRLAEQSFSKQAGKSLVIAVEHHLPRGGSVLDYGAGNGELARLLLDRGYKVATYEPAGSHRSRWLDDLAGHDGFLGAVGPETKQEFDVVLMIEVIEHILDEELEPALWRVHRLLKPGGTLIVTTPNNENLELGMVYSPVSDTLFHRWQHVRSFTADSLSMLLSQHGISPIAVHQVEFRADLFEPFDRGGGGERFVAERSSHLEALRADISVRMAREANLLFVGRKNAARAIGPVARR